MKFHFLQCDRLHLGNTRQAAFQKRISLDFQQNSQNDRAQFPLLALYFRPSAQQIHGIFFLGIEQWAAIFRKRAVNFPFMLEIAWTKRRHWMLFNSQAIV